MLLEFAVVALALATSSGHDMGTARRPQPTALPQTTLLVPLNTGMTNGLFDSQWQTELSITNMGDANIGVDTLPQPHCNIDICFGWGIAAHSTLLLNDYIVCDRGGCLGHVNTDRLNDLSMAMRTHDTSRQSAAWGVSVPVVNDTQFRAERFSLLNIPSDPEFRTTLRVYDVDPSSPPQVLVRVYATDATPMRGGPDTLLFEFTPTFSRGYPGAVAAMSESYLSSIPTLVSKGRLRVEIVPLDGRKVYWGFVSVTNNTTQEVTIVTP